MTVNIANNWVGQRLVGVAKHNVGVRVVVTRVLGKRVFAKALDGSQREFRVDPAFYMEDKS